ncbi:hypothetical protein Sd1_gp8 [Shigella phage Sd1]|uniref:Uncharacterized protein n=1 Tax=Shigella phage Sd1 TaxID=2024313 RepID=A0A291AYI7_9CAUD|nr:hypothetical protein HOR98_gp07 [Shigella phage Sd1]ATE86074.1 hypothetical protein Sd1_gp8 [Shigella phage Sd1]
MKIVDKEMFDLAQIYSKAAVNQSCDYLWMCAKEYLKMAYGL